MSDPGIPDLSRRGQDLIARIDELAIARGINPTAATTDSVQADGNGWIYLLIACRREILTAKN